MHKAFWHPHITGTAVDTELVQTWGYGVTFQWGPGSWLSPKGLKKSNLFILGTLYSGANIRVSGEGLKKKEAKSKPTNQHALYEYFKLHAYTLLHLCIWPNKCKERPEIVVLLNKSLLLFWPFLHTCLIQCDLIIAEKYMHRHRLYKLGTKYSTIL